MLDQNVCKGRRFAKVILDRYSEEKAVHDRAVAYLDRIIDRLINKARGVVTFNSIGNATVALVLRQSHGLLSYLLLAGFVMLAFSRFILLYTMFLGFFGSEEDYRNFEAECENTAVLIMSREESLRNSIYLSVIGFFIAVLAVVYWGSSQAFAPITSIR
jgi:hypothetical protein